MATTIQSGRASSPLLTADVASRAEVYGGRGLVFDGVSDYLDCGYINDFAVTNNVSVSLWFNASGIQDFDCFFSQRANQNNLLKVWYYNNYIIFETKEGGTKAGRMISWTPDSSWHHVVFSFDTSSTIADSKVQIYLDGELPTQTNIGGYGNAGCTESFRIGSANNANYFTGKMSDFKVFKTDSPITLAQVQELYLKPENTPSAVQDSLLAWYPMCESNPESPQSIVYDHSEKKLGSEVLTSSVNNKNNWTPQGSGTNSANITNGVSLTAGDNDVNHYYTVSSGTTTGKLYKFNVDAYIDDASDTNAKINVYSGASNTSEFLTTSSKNYTIYFVQSGTVYIQFSGFDDDTTVYMQNISVKEVLMGNHATTNFFGSELNPNPTFSNFTGNVPDGWGVVGDDDSGNNISQGSAGGLRIQSDGGSIFAHLADVNVVGKTYQFSITIANVNDDDFSFKTSNTKFFNADGKSAGTYTGTYVAEVTYVRIFRDASCDGEITAFSLKEVGISSSGFTTAQNEPVIPQIPLVKYNEKMFFDGIDDKVALGSTLTIASAGGQGSVSAVVNISQIDSTFRMIFGGTHPNLFAYMGYYSNNFKWLIDGAWNTSSTSIVAGKTYHIIGTWNNTSYKFYVNGVLDWSITDSAMLADFHTIGDSPNYEEHHGIIDEVSAWSVELTSTQVQELFNDGVALDATTHSKSGNLLSYHRNDGVTTWQDRRGWSALDFNRSSSHYVDCGDGTSLGFSGADAFSITAWVNVDDFNSNQSITTFGNDTSSSPAGKRLSMFLRSTRQPTLAFWGNDVVSNGTINANEWVHLAMTFAGGNRTSANCKIYINGESQTLSGGTGSALDLSGMNFHHIGADQAPGQYFDGKISSVAIYSGQKSDSEIQSIYNAGINSSETSNSNLVGYWKLDNATTVNDLSSNSANGTVTGATLNTGNDGDVQGSPDSITIREGLNSNKDGLGFPFETNTNNVLRLNAFIDGEKLVIPHAKSLSIGVDFTLEAWVKLKDLSDYRGIVSKRSGTSVNYSFFVTITGSDDGKLGSFDGSSEVISNAAINDNNWHHVAQVHSGTTTTFYIDGDASGGGTQSNFAENTHPIEIGSARTDSNDLWDGLIDEVKIYNRALSVDEVNKNYKHQKGKHKND